jgi:hypothetical protein
LQLHAPALGPCARTRVRTRRWFCVLGCSLLVFRSCGHSKVKTARRTPRTADCAICKGLRWRTAILLGRCREVVSTPRVARHTISLCAIGLYGLGPGFVPESTRGVLRSIVGPLVARFEPSVCVRSSPILPISGLRGAENVLLSVTPRVRGPGRRSARVGSRSTRVGSRWRCPGLGCGSARVGPRGARSARGLRRSGREGRAERSDRERCRGSRLLRASGLGCFAVGSGSNRFNPLTRASGLCGNVGMCPRVAAGKYLAGYNFCVSESYP